MKANNLDIKHVWVKKIRQLIQDTYFGTVSKVGASLPSLVVPSTVSTATSQRSSRDFDTESIENIERGSLASFGSGGTTDSERVSTEPACTSSGAGAGVADTEAVGNLQKLVDETLTLSKS